jgi:diguanylate cyclase (GGDEF)-like protein
LAAVADRLAATVRPGDVVSRFGGDEFLVLCTGLTGEPAAAAVAERIQQTITRPFTIDGLTVRVGVSIGLATYDEDTAGADGLVHHADLAMYRAKQGGRGCTARYTPDMAR